MKEKFKYYENHKFNFSVTSLARRLFDSEPRTNKTSTRWDKIPGTLSLSACWVRFPPHLESRTRNPSPSFITNVLSVRCAFEINVFGNLRFWVTDFLLLRTQHRFIETRCSCGGLMHAMRRAVSFSLDLIPSLISQISSIESGVDSLRLN